MKIHKRIMFGKYKGYTIRQSKYGWYDLYNCSGVSQTNKKNTIEEINKLLAN
jgi:hypothetical protein